MIMIQIIILTHIITFIVYGPCLLEMHSLTFPLSSATSDVRASCINKYIYIYMYVCVCVYIYIYVYVYIYIYIYTYIERDAYVCMCIYIYIYIQRYHTILY